MFQYRTQYMSGVINTFTLKWCYTNKISKIVFQEKRPTKFYETNQITPKTINKIL